MAINVEIDAFEDFFPTTFLFSPKTIGQGFKQAQEYIGKLELENLLYYLNIVFDLDAEIDSALKQLHAKLVLGVIDVTSQDWHAEWIRRRSIDNTITSENNKKWLKPYLLKLGT